MEINGMSTVLTVCQALQMLTVHMLSFTYVQGETIFKTVWHGLQSLQQILIPPEKKFF